MFARAAAAAARASGRVGARVGGRRSFGGGGHHHIDMTKPFEAPHVASWHKKGGEACMFITLFWMMYRCKQDGAVLFVSTAAPQRSGMLRVDRWLLRCCSLLLVLLLLHLVAMFL